MVSPVLTAAILTAAGGSLKIQRSKHQSHWARELEFLGVSRDSEVPCLCPDLGVRRGSTRLSVILVTPCPSLSLSLQTALGIMQDIREAPHPWDGAGNS
jgi:hypothetical protein